MQTFHENVALPSVAERAPSDRTGRRSHMYG